MSSFDSKNCLSMDYKVLGRYTEEAVLKKPSLITLIRQLSIKDVYGTGSEDVSMARLRCISAYVGVPDPCDEKVECSKII